MPVSTGKTNNRITPANNRAPDVANKALQAIIPIQQRRYQNAFKVTPYEVIVYHRLSQGIPCSCGASGKALNARLGEDGKAPIGKINELISGGFEFSIRPYGRDRKGEGVAKPDTANGEKEILSAFEYEEFEKGTMPPFRNTAASDVFEANDIENVDLNTSVEAKMESIISDFDEESLGHSDAACSVCMGTGYVGGFSVYNGWRQVLTLQQPDSVFNVEAVVDTLQRPFRMEDTLTAQFQLILPRGAVSVDAIKAWNLNKALPTKLAIDGTTLVRDSDILAFCDGRNHELVFSFTEKQTLTHFELQLSLSTNQGLVDFPKLSESGDMSKLERLEAFQLELSPSVPFIRARDLLSDSTFGKLLMVENASWWNDDKRQVLGWSCSVRVTQPTELVNLLPKRHKMEQKPNHAVRGNTSR